MPPHPLDSARAQTERAIEQIGNLHQEWLAFLKLNPYRLVAEPNPDTTTSGRSITIRAFIERELPIRFSVLIGEIVHSLRTALDHIVWQLVIANGRTGNRHTGFPVCETAKEFESSAMGKGGEVEGRRRPEGKIERVSAEAQALIESLQPYKTDKRPKDAALYRLHHLDRIHKHRALHVIGNSILFGKMYVHKAWYGALPDGTVPLRSLKINFPRVKTWEGRAVIPFENGAEVARLTSSDAAMNVQQEISFAISFEEPGIVRAQPALPTLDELASFTARTFDAFLLRFFPEGVEGAHQEAPPPNE